MKLIRHIVLACFTLTFFALGTQVLYAQKGQIHSPEELFKILEESEISYALESDEDIEPAGFEANQLSTNLVKVIKNGEEILTSFTLNDEAAEIWEEAEQSFAKAEFEQAIELYHQVLVADPAFTKAYTTIGNAYFNLEQYDSARFYLQKSIDNNFVDYQAHWFLASTEQKTGNDEKALREITIAHILNPGHTVLKRTLKLYRKRMDRPWDEWSIEPAFDLIEESEDEVRVRFANGWMMYALVKALWFLSRGMLKIWALKTQTTLQFPHYRKKRHCLHSCLSRKRWRFKPMTTPT